MIGGGHSGCCIFFLKPGSGAAGYRSPYLSHAKRALYHLSYSPDDGSLALTSSSHQAGVTFIGRVTTPLTGPSHVRAPVLVCTVTWTVPLEGDPLYGDYVAMHAQVDLDGSFFFVQPINIFSVFSYGLGNIHSSDIQIVEGVVETCTFLRLGVK